MIGMLSTVYPFLSYDAAAHLAEEILHAARNIPIAMIVSVLADGVLGFAYYLVLLFGLGGLSDLLKTTTEFSFMQLLLNTAKSTSRASIMSLIPTVSAIAANAPGLASTSCTVWAFARSKAIPASGYFAYVDTRFKINFRVAILVSVLRLVLGFIYLGSTTGFNAILSMFIIGMYLSYALPMIYMLFYGRSSCRCFPGPFNLNTTVRALLWLIVAILSSTSPTFYPVMAANMNYSTVILAGWVADSGVLNMPNI